MERLESGRIAMTVYVGEYASSRSVGRLWKRTDNIKGCLRKRSLDVWQARRMVQDRSVWQGFMRGNAQGVTQGMTL